MGENCREGKGTQTTLLYYAPLEGGGVGSQAKLEMMETGKA